MPGRTGERVAVGFPQVGPCRQAVGPVGEPPRVVDVADVPVPRSQFVHEALEDTAVAEQLEPGFVVHLDPDHGRVARVPAQDGADHPFGVEQERGMGVVDLLAGTPRHPDAGVPLGGDLGVAPRQPRGRAYVGVPRMTEMPRSLAPSATGCSQSRSNAPSLGSPGRPHRFAHPDDRHARGGHQVKVSVQPARGLVLVVIRGPEQYPGRDRQRYLLSQFTP